MRRILATLALLCLVSSGIWAFVLRPADEAGSQFRFAEVSRGNLENVVSGTGSLSAVGTVEVGTQVSGAVDRLLADFNDHVREGQLLAVLDTSALAASVRDAEAGVARALAQYRQAEAEYQRHVPLAERGYLSQQELYALATTVETARATVQSADASLLRAQTNLAHAEIRAPIDGTIIQRSVEAGQTVAASFQAPVLFVIAEDLAQMEILALVDESDIGQIRQGQEVRFTVLTYPDETFHGSVRQIRLQPQTIQNVVNYTVVVDAPNPEAQLLPGMTATVDFVVERVEDVLLAPAAALRFQPTQEMLHGYREARSRAVRAGETAAAGADLGRLWFLDANGDPAVLPVSTGATDGLLTEVAAVQGAPNRSGAQLAADLKVITAVSAGSTGETAANSSGSQRSQGRQMGPPPLF